MALNSIKDYIIKANDLKRRINSSDLKLIDCRWYLGEPGKGNKEYLKSHLQGAIFLDLDELSCQSNDLPHMFPQDKQFAKFTRNFGIEINNEIIIYDQNGFFSSSRVWFMFKYFGFKKIKILDGGINKWKKMNLPLTKIIKGRKKSNYLNNKIKAGILIKKKDLEKSISSKSNNLKIIDARPKKRFLGIDPEPRHGLIKGNIKYSINIPYYSIVEKNGTLKTIQKLKELILKDNEIDKQNEIVCYCGSGITACNIILVLEILGFTKIKLYDGSWAEWGKNKSNQN